MFNVPNLFTLLRLLSAPLVIWAVVRGEHVLAVAVFVGAAVTDVIDGWLARHMNCATNTGAYLDPIADKALLSGVYLALAAGGMLPWWLVGVIFGRDLFILAGALYELCFTPVRKFPPSVWGKLSTFIQIVTAVTWLARNVLSSPVVDAIARGLIWPTAAVTVWSGLHYAWRGFRGLRTH